MTLTPLKTQFENATSLLDLAQRLGEACLDHGGRMLDLIGDVNVEEIAKFAEQRVAAMDLAVWQAPSPEGGFAHALSIDGLGELVEFTEAQHPVEYLAILRGLCHRALPYFYEACEGQVQLDRGTPIPFATRPVNELFGATTPSQRTLSNGGLLEGRAFRLFEHSAGGPVRVVLDFSHRERLDELTWTGEGRLARVATLHPFLGEDGIEVGEVNDSWFFDVRPRAWDLDTLLAQLRDVADAEVAVLPELCLPLVSSLEEALASSADEYPPLVVAGSAHLREPHPSGDREVRANESRVYLDGKRVAFHRKIHPFVTDELPGRELPESLTEGITRETKTITILSGEQTRLAVVICADLNDESIPSLLESAGVNLLLVPALTPDAGAFNGAICKLASRCQAVSVVANAGLDSQPEKKPPFLAMAAAPWPDPGDQSHGYDTPREGCACVGVLDPNVPLTEAMTWLDVDRPS